MRTASLFALFALAFTAAGCTFYEQPRHESYASTGDERCADSSSASIATSSDESTEDESSNEASEPPPPPAHAPKEVGRFEVVAHLVMQSIPYKDCGTGGKGDVDVTFEPSGAVQKVVVYAEGWPDSAKQCVSERFALAHVMPFMGDARTVRWHAELSSGGGWGS